MNILVCCWMAISASGNSGFTLERLLLACICLSWVLIVLYISGTLLKRSSTGTTSDSGSTMTRLWRVYERVNRSLRFRRRKTGEGKVSYGPVWFMAIVAMVAGLVAWRMLPKYPVVDEHNIQVLKQVGPDAWMMRSDEEGDFMYTGCGDFPNSDVIWAGYVARHARWEERGRCKSIRDTGLGFYWLRDSNGNARRIQ
jgi:hypothetical protein